MYSVNEVARYVITRCMENEKPVSNLKLQKMLFFLQIEYYRKFSDLLFNEEFEAWQFGPVVRDIYLKYQGYGASSICRTFEYPSDLFADTKQKKFVDEKIEQLNKKTARELVEKSHANGTPWSDVYKDFKTTIPQDLLIKYAQKENSCG